MNDILSNSSTGQELWKKAKCLIPGGNMLLSKRAEMFLPDQWPSYFRRSKGCKVWDLDGNEFLDFSIMGIGTNTLGYGHSEVDDAVLNVVREGNMSTFNCPEEVYLAERLIDIHPWADMVRFARSGGEANAIAVRIARAASGRDKVAICGYHGWHDWYLSANLSDDKNLDGHLLPGLSTSGVPRDLLGSALPFTYNKIEELEYLVSNYDIGVIKMEVLRNEGPKDNFLKKVKKICIDKNIILIFDECTSGFRETFGGIHKKFDVNPDMAVFGKALGNGYAITSVIGKRSVMESAQNSFISSTFWSERIGPAAALKTLEIMEKTRSWEVITEAGKKIREGWIQIANNVDLDIKISGIYPIQNYSFVHKDNLKFKTLVTQEMLKRGFLSTPLIFTCINHSHELIQKYLQELHSCFESVKKCQDNPKLIDRILRGPVCHNGFKRLN